MSKRVASGSPITMEWIRSRSETDGDCLVWLGAISHGYASARRHGRGWILSRWVLEHANMIQLGPKDVARHVCHNRRCVRPEHVIKGTQQDNMDDCKKAGRTAKGETHSQARLTEKKVLLIRALFASGHRQHEVAKMVDEPSRLISRIVLRQRWSHI